MNLSIKEYNSPEKNGRFIVMIETAIKISLGVVLALSVVLSGLVWERLSLNKKSISFERNSFQMVKSMLPEEQHALLGSWVEPKYDDQTAYQGFTLLADGTMRSINTDLFSYKSWEIRGNQLSLWVESFSEGFTSQDMETYVLEKVSADTLLLKIGESVFKYKRLPSY